MEIQNEINKVKVLMAGLLACVKDKSLSVEERRVYHSDYLQSASYLIQLRREMKKPLSVIK